MSRDRTAFSHMYTFAMQQRLTQTYILAEFTSGSFRYIVHVLEGGHMCSYSMTLRSKYGVASQRLYRIRGGPCGRDGRCRREGSQAARVRKKHHFTTNMGNRISVYVGMQWVKNTTIDRHIETHTHTCLSASWFSRMPYPWKGTTRYEPVVPPPHLCKEEE